MQSCEIVVKCEHVNQPAKELTVKQDATTTLEQIAAEHLYIDTLKTRHSDSLDFHDLAVWQIKEALEAAFKAGQQSK